MTEETDETCLSATDLSGTSACSITYTNVGATARGVFKAYAFFPNHQPRSLVKKGDYVLGCIRPFVCDLKVDPFDLRLIASL